MKAPFPWFGRLPANVADKIGLPQDCGYETPCWPWLAAKTNGYGVVQHEGRLQRAHRVVRSILVGPIPDDLEPDHLCRNRACVNPAHLFVGTRGDNMRDMAAKGRHGKGAPKGERHGMAKLTADQARAIFVAPGKHRDIARAFGVTQPTVSSIKRGELWKCIHAAEESPAVSK